MSSRLVRHMRERGFAVVPISAEQRRPLLPALQQQGHPSFPPMDLLARPSHKEMLTKLERRQPTCTAVSKQHASRVRQLVRKRRNRKAASTSLSARYPSPHAPVPPHLFRNSPCFVGPIVPKPPVKVFTDAWYNQIRNAAIMRYDGTQPTAAAAREMLVTQSAR